MLKNAYLDAKIGVDTAENEPNSLTLGALSLIFSPINVLLVHPGCTI